MPGAIRHKAQSCDAVVVEELNNSLAACLVLAGPHDLHRFERLQWHQDAEAV